METKTIKVVRGNKEEYYEVPKFPGEVVCTTTDFSFAAAVKADHPPKAVLLNCPQRFLWGSRPIPHYVGIPNYNPDYDDEEFLEDGMRPEQQVVEILDWYNFDPDHEIEKSFACYVRDALHEEICEAEDAEMLESVRSIIPFVTDDMIDSIMESHIVGTTRTERMDPYWDGTEWVDPAEEFEQTVINRPMPTVEQKNRKRLFHETEYHQTKTKVERALNQKKVFNSIELDMAFLETERDRTVTKLNTMDPMMDIDKIVPLKAHLYDVMGKIEAFNQDYGIRPIEVREPTLFESAVRKIRGTIAYIGGEVIGKAVNAVATVTAPIRSFISGAFQAMDATALGAVGGLAFLGLRAGLSWFRKAHSL